jgi:serine/threonine protein kinase
MNEENSGLIPITDHELFQATTARGFEPGTVVFNRFVLTRVLGRGGMGIVWLAHDQQLEQDVAIKVLPDVVMHDKEAISDMKRETKRSLQLNHHNIVRIYDFNQDERGAGISMEYVDGETLSAAKAERPEGCFDVEQVGPWLEQMCDALAYAHDTAKIVHRDLKPANIMLSRNNTIKVTDFGIARSISDSISRVSMRHASSGTMVYMSPQQSGGARSSSLDDIYALGATLYDLLTGKPPFYSGNIQHQLENIVPPRLADRRAELDRHGARIPEIWEQAVASCLEKEPSRRPQSVQELAYQLGLRVLAPMPAAVPIVAAVPQYERTIQEVPLSNLERTATGAPPPTTYPPYAAAPQPAYQPAPSFFTPDKIKWISILGGCVAGLILVGFLIMIFSKGHGSVVITSMPPGAIATVGSQKKATPATFDEVDAGNATLNLALDGYDPAQVGATITKNEKTDLGSTTLKRSTGLVSISAIPKAANGTLRLVQSDVAGEPAGTIATFSGAIPWPSSPLKTGKYQIVATAPGFPDAQQEIDVKRGDTQQVVVDLVKEATIHALSTDEAAAVATGQPLPDKLKQDPAAKDRLTSYYQKMFDGYMKAGEFDLAQMEIKQLSDNLGVDTADRQKQIDDARLIALKGQGTMQVKTNPSGAAITVNGKTQPSPAVFQTILAGTQTVDIKMAGYAPLQMPAQITRDTLTDLGTVPLTRETGSVEISPIPRTAACTLRLVHSQAPVEAPSTIANFSGPATYQNAALGTGTYSVTASGEGFPATTQTIEIKKNDHLQVTVDLVKLGAMAAFSPDLAAVVASDQSIPEAVKQNPTSKATLTAYYQQTLQGYLRLKEFKLAESQLHHLSSDLGVESTDAQKQLDALQTEWITTETTNIQQLIVQEKFDEADTRLKDMETHGPQPGLRSELDKAKSDHELTVTKALADVDAQEAAGNEPAAYQTAVAAATKDMIEPRLVLRVANLELPMPSTYERVSGRIKALTALSATNPTMDQNADCNRLMSIFQKNLEKHTALRAQIAAVKHDLDSYAPKIAALRGEAKHNEDKANGYRALSILGIGGAAGAASQNSAAGAFAGIGAAGLGQNSANARENDVQSDNARVRELLSAQSAKEEELNQLRGQYDVLQKSPINSIQ